MMRNNAFSLRLRQLSSLPEVGEARVGGRWMAIPPLCLNAAYEALPSLPGSGDPEWHTPFHQQSFDARLSWLLALGAGGSHVQRRGVTRLHRVYPTSGNLQSVQSYLIEPSSRSSAGTAGARVSHYDPARHAVAVLSTALAPQQPTGGGVYLAFASVPGRQVVKYGARGLRYSFLDLGHALAAQLQAAHELGWNAAWIACSRCELQAFLALDAQPSFEDVEAEAAGAVLYLSPSPIDREAAQCLWRALLQRDFQPAARRAKGPALADDELSCLLRDAHRARIQGPTLSCEALEQAQHAGRCEQAASPAATASLLQRRTPDAFNPCASLSHRQCEELVRAIEASEAASSARSLVQRIYFVHEVEGLPSGLYLPRVDKGRLHPLRIGSQRDDVHFLTAFQAKARDCSVLVLFTTTGAGLESYEQAHVRAGMLGQMASQAAAKRGVRASGLGAFFDDHTRQFLADLHLDGEPIYWLALGHAKPSQEVAS